MHHIFFRTSDHDAGSSDFGQVGSGSVAGKLHSVHDDVRMGYRDGKGNDSFPCGTGADTGDIAETEVPAQESAADTRRGAVRVYDDVFKSSDDVPA